MVQTVVWQTGFCFPREEIIRSKYAIVVFDLARTNICFCKPSIHVLPKSEGHVWIVVSPSVFIFLAVEFQFLGLFLRSLEGRVSCSFSVYLTFQEKAENEQTPP